MNGPGVGANDTRKTEIEGKALTSAMYVFAKNQVPTFLSCAKTCFDMHN